MTQKSSLLDKLSYRLAKESGRDEEVILFGLRLFVASAAGYAALIIIASLLGVLSYALTAAVTASVFRVFSGGAHAFSPVRCSLMGIIIFSALGFLAKSHPDISSTLLASTFVVISACGLYIIYRYVPAETPGKPISSSMQRRYLRTTSFSLLIIWSIAGAWLLNSPVIDSRILLSSCAGLAWQLLSLTPFGFKVVGGIDTTLKYFMERRE